jgi:hypothetical protein
MTQEVFLKDVSNWSNHRHFLWLALEKTSQSPSPVLELGVGEGSTPYLRSYCDERKRRLLSYDNNNSWAEKYGAMELPVNNPNDYMWSLPYSVVLVDHAPGEHRRVALRLLLNAEIIVIHDSEPAGWTAADYRVREEFKRFRYVADYEDQGAWATALSNTIDVSSWQHNWKGRKHTI